MPKTPSTLMAAAQISGKRVSGNIAMAGSASVHRFRKHQSPDTDRNQIAQLWQIEAYRQLNICGEARYAATLFASLAGRAEIGVSEPQTLSGKAVWVESGPEVDAFAEIAPTVRERSKLIRDYMLHRTVAGECYLIARERLDTDPGYIETPIDPLTGEQYDTWAAYLEVAAGEIDLWDEGAELPTNPNADNPVWEIVAVTELRRIGTGWEVRVDNNRWHRLAEGPDADPIIRFWNPDPEDRREAWSPFRSLLPTLKEIEWETAHIFRQLRTRLINSGVWFLPENITFPKPPADSIEGGEETMATLNEAELFALSLAESSMQELDAEEVSYPTVVMASPEALAAVDQTKLIQFWSEIDDKAMILRSDAVRRFALGMDLPPEQVLGSSGLAVSGTSGSAGSVNHWGVWANEEQTIKAHIEPALDDLVGTLTVAVIHVAVENPTKVIGYDTARLRMRPDRSQESIELYDRGLIKAEVAIRENGFDPDTDKMDDEEFRRWLLVRITGGSATPEQVQAAMGLLGQVLPVAPPVSGNEGGEDEPAPGQPGRNQPRSLEGHPYQGPPRETHEHEDAPFSALHASCEGLVLRALEKAGNRLLNNGVRGRDRDRETPAYRAHLVASVDTEVKPSDFDFSTASLALADYPARDREVIERLLAGYCVDLYTFGTGYTRDGLTETLKGF